MKKLLLIFAVVLMVVLAAGCNARRKNAEFATDETATVVTVEGEEENPEPTRASALTASGELAVTSFPNGRLETNRGYQVVRGTTPSGTQGMEVNGYRLRRYRPGQPQWVYIASTGIGTLREGQNDYTARALDNAGSEIAAADFTIVYNPAAPSLPGVGSSLWLVILMAGLGNLIWFISIPSFFRGSLERT